MEYTIIIFIMSDRSIENVFFNMKDCSRQLSNIADSWITKSLNDFYCPATVTYDAPSSEWREL